jgi:hypothetical protein
MKKIILAAVTTIAVANSALACGHGGYAYHQVQQHHAKVTATVVSKRAKGAAVTPEASEAAEASAVQPSTATDSQL